MADGLLQAALQELSIDGVNGCEGVAFFLGRHYGADAHITDLVVLRGTHLTKTENHLQISAELMNEVTDHVTEQQGVLLGQIHSHGPGYGVDLSYSDHFCGIRAPGFLSIVAPDFALRTETQLGDCGIHVFDAPNGFRRLSHREISNRFGVLAGKQIQLLTAQTCI
jgi:hypothetical protein